MLDHYGGGTAGLLLGMCVCDVEDAPCDHGNDECQDHDLEDFDLAVPELLSTEDRASHASATTIYTL